MEIISSGKRYGLGDPEIEATLQEIVFSSDEDTAGTTEHEVLEMLVSKVQLTNRTTGKYYMALLHLKLALESLTEGTN